MSTTPAAARPDRYAVIGNPIAHSKSPEIHARFAQQTGQHIVYERLLAPLDGFAEAVRRFRAAGGMGANVTVPFKLEAHALASTLTDRARAAGAVNTLAFRDEGIFGDNTDGVGLVRDIVVNAGVKLRGKRILLLGAGGAARGVMLPLLNEGPAELVVANRTAAKAEELAQQFSDHGPAVLGIGLDVLEPGFDIVINATSASLSSELPPLPDSLFGGGVFAYDMVYGAALTPFLALAGSRGATVRDGLGMLVEQAAESFSLWRGVRPDTGPVYAHLRSVI